MIQKDKTLENKADEPIKQKKVVFIWLKKSVSLDHKTKIVKELISWNT